MPWPKEVDVLTARNIHKGSLGSGNCRCAIGWMYKWFGYTSKEATKAYQELSKVLHTNEPISWWNDSQKTHKSDIAKALNQMTAKLGYTEGNPEA